MSLFPFEECACCGSEPKFSVLLAVGPNGDSDEARFFIPNQNVREAQGTGFDCAYQVPFCQRCIRVVEDNLRASIRQLSEQNGKSHPKYRDFVE